MTQLDNRLVVSLILISIGVFALLQNFGLVHLAHYLIIINLWPLILVLAGIRLVVRQAWLRIVFTLFIFVAFWFFIMRLGTNAEKLVLLLQNIIYIF
jgi:hypothetical protein